MARGNLDIARLTVLLQENSLSGNPPHLTHYVLRMTEGWWGPFPRYTRVRIILQDESGNPLSQPRWELVDRMFNPLRDPILETTLDEMDRVFDGINLSPGTERYGPLCDGNFLYTDDAWNDFNPMSALEVADVELTPALYREHLNFLSRVAEGMLGDIIMLKQENEDAHETITRLRERIINQPTSAPIITSTPGGVSGLPPSVYQPTGLHETYIQPSRPMQPSAPPLPLMGDLGSGILSVLPISQIRTVIGNTPVDPKKVPLWIAKSASAIEGVMPTNTPDIRCRLVNALLPQHGGLILQPHECNSWTQIASALYTRVNGMIPLHALPQTLSQVTKEEGILVAYQIGMTFTGQNFPLTWGILRPLLPGQAVVAMMQGYLDQYPTDDLKAVNFASILRRVFDILGLNYMGQNIRNQSSPSLTVSSARGATGRGRGRSRNIGRGRGTTPNFQGRGQPATTPTVTTSGSTSSTTESQGRNSNPNYNFRPRVNQPPRYGGGPNPYRNREPLNNPPNRENTTQNNTRRPGSQGQNRNRNQNRTVNAVQVVPNQDNTNQPNINPNQNVSTPASASGGNS
ncbi:gag [Squirrel monkey simian foamy virus]|uniref:Gag polyprotein n=1 Tax=Squirrel monkey simian foamy virus TaxID=2170201 RepID=D5JWU5_9RETR|nr:gag [Squirrel monkey simian foamy virus]ADE05994.1 gag [Squirrel monkey simian foamy virus]